MAAHPLFPFVFVGCWNQPGVTCKDTSMPRNTVAEAIRNMTDIKHIILGGDNVYPRPLESGEKNKVHDPTVFDEGIKLFPATDIPIILAFGNHNVDTIDHQMKMFNLTKTYYHREFVDGVHVLVLDTNIVLNGAADPKYDTMCRWFADTVRDLPAGHQYFVVQHEPYFTARFKKGSNTFGALINADPLLDTMFTRLPIAVLCADTHHYQHATIQLDARGPAIHQFIVGTGGASPDAHAVDFREPRKERDKYFFTQVDIVPGYGFLRIEDTDPTHFVFKPVEHDWIAKGGARKQRTRATRRLSRKRRKSQKRR